MRLPKLIVVCLLAGSLAARADDLKEQARRDVDAALTAQSAGQYDEAIALYKKAYAAIPHPEILFNLGQAYRLKGDVDTALDYYRRYLAAEPSGRAAGDASRWVTELGKRKREQDRKAEEARKADEARKARRAEEGRRAEEARKAEEARTVEPATSEPVRMSAPPDAAATATAATSITGDASTAPDAAERSGPEAGPLRSMTRGRSGREAGPLRSMTRGHGERPTHSNAAAWITGVGGGAALIGGLVFGSLARSKLDAATAICGSDHRCDNDADTAHANALVAQSRTRGTVSTTLIIVGAGGLAASAILWWQGRHSDASGVAIAPIVTPHSVGLALGGAL
jgi:tetratricopeptide (TPR) repeat protein